MSAILILSRPSTLLATYYNRKNKEQENVPEDELPAITYKRKDIG